MKFIVFLLLFFALENKCDLISHEGPIGPREAQVEWFPYGAVIEPVFCAGILISEQYVITPAYCVSDSSDVTVYLGFRGTPETRSNRNEKKTQIFKSSHVIVHEDFQSSDEGYINNIALVKLSKTAMLNEKVSPAKLFSNKEMDSIENKFANVTGWFSQSTNSKLHVERVQILSQDTCNLYYGSDLIESQELCAKAASSSTFLNVLGDAVVVNDKIVGLLTKRHTCLTNDLGCEKTHIFINLIPFLGWISEKTNIPIEKLTGETKLEDSSKMLRKIDDLFELIQQSQIKQEQEKASDDEKMERLLEDFNKTKDEMFEQKANLEEKEKTRINDLEIQVQNIQETVLHFLQESNFSSLKYDLEDIITTMKNEESQICSNLEKQLEQVLQDSREMKIKINKILEFISEEPLA